MPPPSFVSLFTGFDGAGWGARAAGYSVLGGVEFRPDIAAVAQQNDPAARFVVGDVRAVDYRQWRGATHLHASPSCKKASIANADRGETEEDRETAAAVERAIREIGPHTFTLENVRGYLTFDAYRSILDTLAAEGYGYAAGVLNAANYGVAQTRDRLIVVAVRGLPSWRVSLPPATHARRKEAGAGQMALFEAEGLPPWVGWYEAIEDLIPSLPASRFAPWQLARLPEEVRESVLIDNQNASSTQARNADEPSMTITTRGSDTGGRLARAFILDGQESSAEAGLTLRDGEAPCFTVTSGTGTRRAARAWLVNGTSDMGLQAPDDPAQTVLATLHSKAAPPRAWLSAGRTVQLTPRALARLQSFPDAYVLPDKASLACEGIGNAVPPLLMRRIMEHVRAITAERSAAHAA